MMMIDDTKKIEVFCRLKRGNETKYAWVPQEFASFGANLIITKNDGKIEKGWYIIRVNRHKTRSVVLVESNDSEGESKRLVA